jgi:hypothetical protein
MQESRHVSMPLHLDDSLNCRCGSCSHVKSHCSLDRITNSHQHMRTQCDGMSARHNKQLSRSRRSDFLMILAAVRNGMALLLTGRPTVISLAPGGMHGSCS